MIFEGGGHTEHHQQGSSSTAGESLLSWWPRWRWYSLTREGASVCLTDCPDCMSTNTLNRPASFGTAVFGCGALFAYGETLRSWSSAVLGYG